MELKKGTFREVKILYQINNLLFFKTKSKVKKMVSNDNNNNHIILMTNKERIGSYKQKSVPMSRLHLFRKNFKDNEGEICLNDSQSSKIIIKNEIIFDEKQWRSLLKETTEDNIECTTYIKGEKTWKQC